VIGHHHRQADFKIDIITLLFLTVIAVFVPRTLSSVFRSRTQLSALGVMIREMVAFDCSW
jgi:hypothetical protein